MELDQMIVAGFERLASDFELFALECLKIKDKAGKIQPFAFNKAQRHIHARLEQQKKETGRVRALLLKGRQQGGSTYIGGRFYWNTTMNGGQTAFIMAHEAKATSNLFDMVNRYHDYNPLAPSTSNSNATELVFDKLDGGYKLATAGSEDVGRSNTSQFFHGSEVAFWKNGSKHLAGIGNTVADSDGTEIVLESTANGIGNTFHQMWQKAKRGEGEYIAIFVPWFWQDEYQAEPREGFEESLSEEDCDYMETYGLTLPQMQWRANKIATYDEGEEWLFDQEYPACDELAFQIPKGNPLIKVNAVMRAVKSAFMDRVGTLVLGCDPASDGEGSDTTAMAWRRGRVVLKIERHHKDEMQIAGILAGYWILGDEKGRRPDAIFIDKGGIGSGIVSRLKELNIPVIGVMFGSSATNDELYANKRTEMHYAMRDWFNDEPNRIPNDAGLISALCATQPKPTSNARKSLESKAEVKKRLGRSPDEADALALTFAAPVEKRTDQAVQAASSGHYAPTIAGY